MRPSESEATTPGDNSPFTCRGAITTDVSPVVADETYPAEDFQELLAHFSGRAVQSKGHSP